MGGWVGGWEGGWVGGWEGGWVGGWKGGSLGGGLGERVDGQWDTTSDITGQWLVSPTSDVSLAGRPCTDVHELFHSCSLTRCPSSLKITAGLGQLHQPLRFTFQTHVDPATTLPPRPRPALPYPPGLPPEELDESLQVFDTKLRTMKEDIAAIETSNNTLELQVGGVTRSAGCG